MPYIKESCKDKILEAARIEEVIGEFVKLERSGANFKAKSPFQTERSGSFVVSPVKQIFKCFSSGKGGTAVSFLMEKDIKGMSYPEALEHIAKKYSIPIEYEELEFSEKKVKQLEEKDKLRKVLKLVHELYIEQYNKSASTDLCRQEVEGKREYNQEKIIDWGIGFAPENFLYDRLNSSGYLKQGEALGLIHTSERGNVFDKYSNRVIYPIHDRNGLIIGLSGRDLTATSKMGKWINPPVNTENIIYNKSRVWFGLHKAKLEMRRSGEAFIVEGYNDVIAFHEYGIENTVSPCGTAITDDQISEIKKFCDKVVFCMDPDKAGMAAVLKHIPRFISQGFRVEVLTLDLDPDDFVRRYHDLIAIAGGLNAMLKTPGVRVDGFQLLINDKIKKDFIHIENELKTESSILVDYENKYKIDKQLLTNEVATTEGDYLQAKSLLKEIELSQDKKSTAFIEQNKTTTTLKATLDSKKHKLKNFTEPVELKRQKDLVMLIKLNFENAFKNSETNRATGAKDLCATIINVKDDAYFEIYLNWIQIESKVGKSKLNSWIKELREENTEIVFTDYDDLDYELPKDVKIPFKDLENDIKLYGLFMANNKIYFSINKAGDYKVNFVALSNFDIEILQHMADEKYASLLIRMKNVMNNETIFDCPTETFNSLIRFKDVLSKHHNFIFKGKNDHLEKLHIFLSSKMGKGVKLDVPGFQLEGKFWVFNNLVITYDGELESIDENGRYIQDNVHYYIPSANKIFKNNPYKYMQDKNFRHIKNEIPFLDFMTQAAKVHRQHYISPILYGIASLFRDLIINKLNSFPILFLYGQGGTGKDELGRMVMSLTGVPQMPISLEAEISTQKATMRMLAKFRNGIMMFSEYKRGNQKQDGALKGIYDNIGYSIGTLESKFSTDYIPVEAGLILTGNEFPDSEPLLQRLIWTQMDKNVFTQKEKEYMEVHKQHLSKGMSEYAVIFLRHRKLVEEKFLDKYNEWSAILTKIFPEVKVRIVNNLSVIAAIYDIFSDIVQFPFTKFEMIDNFKVGVEQQMKRINSTSVLAKFWECFISCFRGNVNDRIQAHKIVNIEGSSLYVQWTHVFTKIQIQWFLLHKEAAPRKDVIMEEIKKIPNCYVNYHDTYSFEKGRGKVRSSAYELNLLSLDGTIRNDILGAFMEQIYTENLFGEDEIKNIDKMYYENIEKTTVNIATPIDLPDSMK